MLDFELKHEFFVNNENFREPERANRYDSMGSKDKLVFYGKWKNLTMILKDVLNVSVTTCFTSDQIWDGNGCFSSVLLSLIFGGWIWIGGSFSEGLWI